MTCSFFDASLKLNDGIKEVIKSMGFDDMTPVQSAVIPQFLNHKDVAVQACTGSGKTLAYVIPVIEILNRMKDIVSNSIGGLVILPTHELAKQVYSIFNLFVEKFPFIKPILLVGGVDVSKDLESLKQDGLLLLVGTPGRLNDIFNKSEDNLLNKVEVLILDEADVLLAKGFLEALKLILNRLPKQRRTGLFSATLTTAVKELGKCGLRNPISISIKVNTTTNNNIVNNNNNNNNNTNIFIPKELENYYIVCNSDEKISQISHFLHNHKNEKVMIFFMTCNEVDFFTKIFKLLFEDISSNIYEIHGKMVNKKRNGMYSQFLNNKSGILLCTDVAARGLDVPKLDWIIQYSPPQEPEFYIHRIGRTARAGNIGNALLFILPSEESYIEFLKGRNIPISKLDQFKNNTSEIVLSNNDLVKKMKDLIKVDRDLYERSISALTAFVRAYKNHKLSIVFVFNEINLVSLLDSFGIIKKPKMPELKNLTYAEEEDIDIDSIPYKDEEREKARQLRLANPKEKKIRERKDDDGKRDKYKAKNKNNKPEKRKRKKKSEIFQEEWDEFAEDTRLLKRMRKGKISKEEYEKKLLASDDF